MLILRAYGQAQFEVGATIVTPAAARPFACLLRLAGARGAPVARAGLAAMLWPESGDAQRRHALRQLLYRLRRCGVAFRETDAGIALPREALAETHAFDPTLETVRALLSERRGEWPAWLPDYAPRLSPTFTAWLESERDLVGTRLRRALDMLFDEARSRGDASEIGIVAGALIRLDPLHAGARRVVRDGRRAPAPIAVGLVARERECAALADSVADAVAKDGHLLTIRGASGSGISALVEQAAQYARSAGAAVVRCVAPLGVATPTDALRLVIGALFVAPGALGCSPSALAQLRRVGTADIHGEADGARDASAVAVLESALGDLVDAICDERPLVLVIDGWRPNSNALLEPIACLARVAQGRAMLVVVGQTVKPRELPRPEPAGLARVIALGPLDTGASQHLVRAVVERSGGALTVDDVAWCIEQGQGLPGRLVKLAAACREQSGSRSLPASIREAAAD